MNLIEHLPGCTPHKPCNHCKVMDILRNKLSASDIEKIAGLLADGPIFKHIDDLELSVRTANSLRNDNLITLGEIAKKTEGYFLKMPNFGRKSLSELKEVLAKHGMQFSTS